METKHTPTPWEIEFESRDAYGRKGYSIGHRGKGSIFEMVYTGRYAADSPREHAEFIVRAVNNHEALLKAAKYFRSLIDADLLDSLTRGSNPYDDAIARAEGQS